MKTFKHEEHMCPFCPNKVMILGYIAALEEENQRLQAEIARLRSVWTNAWYEQRDIIGKLWWHHPQVKVLENAMKKLKIERKSTMKWFKPWVYWIVMSVFIALGGVSVYYYLTDLTFNYYPLVAFCGVCATICAAIALHTGSLHKENNQ